MSWNSRLALVKLRAVNVLAFFFLLLIDSNDQSMCIVVNQSFGQLIDWLIDKLYQHIHKLIVKYLSFHRTSSNAYAISLLPYTSPRCILEANIALFTPTHLFTNLTYLLVCYFRLLPQNVNQLACCRAKVTHFKMNLFYWQSGKIQILILPKCWICGRSIYPYCLLTNVHVILAIWFLMFLSSIFHINVSICYTFFKI